MKTLAVVLGAAGAFCAYGVDCHSSESAAPVPTRTAAPLSLKTDAPVAQIDERYLAVAIDSAQLVGATWWDPSGMVEGGGGTAKLSPYDFSRPRLRRLAKELA